MVMKSRARMAIVSFSPPQAAATTRPESMLVPTVSIGALRRPHCTRTMPITCTLAAATFTGITTTTAITGKVFGLLRSRELGRQASDIDRREERSKFLPDSLLDLLWKGAG